MSNIESPTIKLSSTRQGAMYRIRRSHRANGVVGTLTAWSHGLVVNEGQYVQSYGQAYQAQNSGTTGATAPSGVESVIVSDGVIHWLFVNNKTFLTNQTPSTPA